MCGIFGVVGRDLRPSAVENVFDVLSHRGPDGRGFFEDRQAKLTLVHTRLSVIDILGGAQPLESEDGSVILIANGEIYDFERIRGSLENEGHHFRTGSDSEVIIHLYREFGAGCFAHLRGEFAFLLYDKQKQSLIAARDRFGIKPLYVSRIAAGFVFASEMKAIFASGLVAPKLNPVGLDPLTLNDPHYPAFPFEGIEHVPPGCYLEVNMRTREGKLTRYWSAELPSKIAEPVEPTDAKAAAFAQSVIHELEEAVRLRLRADVPVGLYLSGGVDSALVGALMSRNLGKPLESFSITFEGSDRSEHEFARKAARLIGSNHHELTVTKHMLWHNLKRCLWFSELPFVTLAPVGKFLLSREARKSVTVVLTGEGADEVFLGYPSFFRNAIRDGRRRNGSQASSNSAQARRLRIGRSSLARKISLLIFHRDHRSRLAEARAQAIRKTISSKPIINAVQEQRLAGMPLDVLCYLGDREEMAHSIEARLPFLDDRLYEVAQRIPVDFKMRRGTEKAVLREAAKGILPDELRLRPKSGFMLTSDAVDLFGRDRAAAHELRRYLSRAAFDQAQVFSYRAYRIAALLGRLPSWTRKTRQLRQNANKLIMYMMQVHMLEDMFIANPCWRQAREPMPDANKAEALALTS